MTNPRRRRGEALKHIPFDMQEHFAELTAAMQGKYAFLEEGLSDIQVVIIATSLLDKFLSFYLTVGFKPDNISKQAMADTFGGNGPLATFSSKITVCNLMGYLVEEQTHDFKILKTIRNDFAHSLKPMSLADARGCDNLRLQRPNLPVPKGDRRAAFVSSAAQLVIYCAYGVTALLARQQFLTANNEAAYDWGIKLAREMMGPELPPVSDAQPQPRQSPG